MSTVVLETRGLVKRFGGIAATNDVSLKVEKGARHALIGPNGAGKTTLINLLTGVLEPTGRHGRARRRRHHAARRAPARAPRPRPHVPDQPAVQRADAAAVARADGLGRTSAAAAAGGGRSAPTRASPTACEALLTRFRLDEVMNQKVAQLAYGKRRLLEIATALACEPRVLLLDEPVAGVPEGERQEIFESINALPADVSVLLIEHDMDLVFNFARSVTVLVNGAVFAEGDVQAIANDPRVKAVYLGEQAHG